MVNLTRSMRTILMIHKLRYCGLSFQMLLLHLELALLPKKGFYFCYLNLLLLLKVLDQLVPLLQVKQQP